MTHKLGTLLVAAAVVGVVSLTAAPAQACGWIEGGWHAEWLRFRAPVPDEGVATFGAHAGGGIRPEYLEVEVTDSAGEAVPGEVRLIEMVSDSDPDRRWPPPNFRGDPPGADWFFRVMVVWQPLGPLEPDARYDMHVLGRSYYADYYLTDVTKPFYVREMRIPTLPRLVSKSVDLSLTRARDDIYCCEKVECSDSCNECGSCWAERFAYLPTIRVQLNFDRGTLRFGLGEPPTQHLVRAYVNGELRWQSSLYDEVDFELFLAESTTDPVCLQIEAENLATEETVYSETWTLNRSDFPAAPADPPVPDEARGDECGDAPTRPSGWGPPGTAPPDVDEGFCASITEIPAPDTEPGDWQPPLDRDADAGSTGALDAGSLPDISASFDSGADTSNQPDLDGESRGCSTSDGPTPGLLSLLLALGMAMVCRRTPRRQ